MIKIIVAFVIFEAFVYGKDNRCPAKYRRLSANHSFCQPPNSTCNFVTKGLKKAEIAEILKIHNDYRSKVALGKETNAGGLPTASNVLELTWDKEIAEIAQRHAEQCQFEHDCKECRQVRGFSVGQNIAYNKYYCQGKCEVEKPDWNGTIAMWYNEVNDFDKSLVPSLKLSRAVIGHFTQVVWAETFKIGCGYAAFEEDDGGIKQLYVCNYGPAGNMRDAALYKQGASCSDCPKNSHCNSGEGAYPNLCHLTSYPPIFTSRQNLLFNCAFQDGDRNCEFDSNNGEIWKLAKTSGGNLLSVVIRERKSATVHFRQPFKSKKGSCMTITLRKGPTIAGEKDESNLEVEFEQNGRKHSVQVFTFPWADFIKSPVQVNFDGEKKFSIKMSVPAGIPPQYIDIKQIEVIEEACKYGK